MIDVALYIFIFLVGFVSGNVIGRLRAKKQTPFLPPSAFESVKIEGHF